MRLGRLGPNELPRTPPVPAIRLLLDQFRSVVVLLLLVAGIVALALGDRLEAAGIAAVLVVNTLIAFVVELRARRAMDALLGYESPMARVRRDGTVVIRPSRELVRGDVIELEEGDAVPADARLLEAASLRVDEAPLTGESLPVEKDPEALLAQDTPIAERVTLVHAGTTVVGGRGAAVVCETGPGTELGRVGALLASVEAEPTPLERRLDALGRRLVALTLGVAGLVTALGTLRGQDPRLTIETGLALAIAAVPEGLPAVATIALAIGLRRMAKRHALVRRLAAVEALGAATVVCTDKTGTLTAGRMRVAQVALGQRVVEPGSPGYRGARDRLARACAFTTRASRAPDTGEMVGDPTDAALRLFAEEAGLGPEELRAQAPVLRDIPFDAKQRISASVHELDGVPRIFVKGAPQAVLERASRSAARDGVSPSAGPVGPSPSAGHEHDTPMGEDDRVAWLACNEEMAARGLRVIALAEGVGEGPQDLTLIGLVGILDPPAEGVAETIGRLRSAGIRTLMVTGDQKATAETIADQVGSRRPDARTLSGREIAALRGDALGAALRDVDVVARVSPEDKIDIVAALRASGEVVAMLGDGVNDAPALKGADVGVAMGGRGTDVARQAAAIILVDDRFTTIGAAVEEGRVIFDNIRKFVFYLFSCNLAEVAVILGASVAGTTVPLLPLQILWLNLVTDTFPALALALEPAEPGVMARAPRRPDRGILSARFVRAVVLYAVLITVVTLVAFFWTLERGDPAKATTMAFMTLALAQLFHLGNARARGAVVRPERVMANRWALAAVALVLLLQVASVAWAPLAGVLRTMPLTAAEWALSTALALVPAVAGQLLSLRRTDRPPDPPPSSPGFP